MSWLLFLDESGHDHKTMPYEVRGGFALHATKLWPFITAVRTLEQSIFGSELRQYGLEIKGSKLLRPRCFQWQAQGPTLDDAARVSRGQPHLSAISRTKTGIPLYAPNPLQESTNVAVALAAIR